MKLFIQEDALITFLSMVLKICEPEFFAKQEKEIPNSYLLKSVKYITA